MEKQYDSIQIAGLDDFEGGFPMYCHLHPDQSAIGTCVGCGKFICKDCTTEIQNKYYCKSCVNELFTENKRRIEKLEANNRQQQPVVYMNAGGGSSSSSSSSASSGQAIGGARPLKSKVAAGLLAIFLGGIGAHKFYLGKPVQGLLYLVLCWTFIPAAVAFIEGIMYLVSSDEAFAHKYGAKV